MIEFLFIGLLGLMMGIVTSISGGSGVFAVPLMLAFGISPINTLALNRTADLGTIFGAFRSYYKSKSIDWKLALIIIPPLAIGSLIGASVVVRLPEEILKYIIVCGVFVGIFFLLKPAKENITSKKKSVSIFGLFLMFLVGLWSGALAMAGATFAVLVMVHFFGKSFLQGRATDIVASVPETIISAGILIYSSNVSIWFLLTILTADFIGAWIGAHFAVKHGNKLIKSFMVGIAILMIIKIIFKL